MTLCRAFGTGRRNNILKTRDLAQRTLKGQVVMINQETDKVYHRLLVSNFQVIYQIATFKRALNSHPSERKYATML